MTTTHTAHLTMRILLLIALLASAAQASAQSQPRDSVVRAELTLEEAIALARRNNPELQQVLNNRATARAAVRSAYGQLLPSADVSLSAQRQQGGRQIFNGASLGASSDVNQSNYRLGIGYRINSATLFTPSLQRANRDAVEADITGATETLRDRVSQQYLTALQAEANADLQDTLVLAAQQQVVLAQAREIVGSGTQLDVSRAEVALGLQQVQVLRARNTVDVEKLRLFQLMGVNQPLGVKLVSRFAVLPITLRLEDLLATARKDNPVVVALRSRERVAELNVKREKSEYSPTLSLSTGIGGYTYGFADGAFPVAQAMAQTEASFSNCVRTEEVRAAVGLPNNLSTCSAFVFSDARADAIRRENGRFPFNFTNQPRSITANLSLPLFDGFAREQRVQEAIASRSDARYGVRARELALTADVTAAYLTVTTAARAAALQEQNAAKARQELKLVQDRYQIGATTFIDLTEARATYERAESERINAIYEYHKAFAALESAVGRPLR